MRTTAKKAFTLVEMLIAIVIIGAIAGMGIPAVVNIFGEAASAKTTRNAHTIVTTYAGARAAGATFTSCPTDVRGTVLELFEGKNGAGMMADARFSVNPLVGDDLNAVLQRLRYVEETDSLVIASPKTTVRRAR